MAKGRRTGGGSRKGIPNKVTADVREAMAIFARAHISDMTGWLQEIKDPAKKMDLFLRAIEYHVPKLARTEGAGPGGEHLHRVYSWKPPTRT